MKALTLWQPWASLVAEGIKTIETRSWRAPAALIGERIAIHAAAKEPRRGMSAGGAVVELFGQSVYMDEAHDGEWLELPLGAVLCTARLVDCVETDCMAGLDWIVGSEPGPADPSWYVTESDYGGRRWNLAADRPFGDYAPGRWAWLLDDVAPPPCVPCRGTGHMPFDLTIGEFTRCERCDGLGRGGPVPARGRQRLWEWTL